MQDAADNGGGGFALPDDFCNNIAALQFDLEGTGVYGTGSFKPPQLQAAAMKKACYQRQFQLYKNAGSVAPVPTPSTSSVAAVDYTPLIYLLAILIVVRVVL